MEKRESEYTSCTFFDEKQYSMCCKDLEEDGWYKLGDPKMGVQQYKRVTTTTIETYIEPEENEG